MTTMPTAAHNASPLVAFPPELATAYLRSGAWDRVPLAASFHMTAERYPDRVALVCGSASLTYRELDEVSDRRAGALSRLGLQPGGAVLLQVGNSVETVLTWYALLKAGLIPVCTLAHNRHHEISEIGRQTQPVAHIVDARAGRFDLVGFALEESAAADRPWRVLVQNRDEALPEGADDLAELTGQVASASDARRLVEQVQNGIKPENVAVLQLSGGTTGVPKVIPRLHGEYWYNARQYAAVLDWNETDRVACIGPIVHNAGIICGLHGPHAVGAAALLGTPDLNSLYELMVREHATDAVLLPFAYEAALDERLSAENGLRRVLFTGKAVPESHFDALSGRGVWVGQLFGMGEGLCMITPLDAPREVRLLSVGVPISPYDEALVLEPGGPDPVLDEEPGELCARGPYTLRGYYNASEHNAQAFTRDGYYRTGDMVARRTIAGHIAYTMEGRIKDLINRGGEKVNAAEMETLLVQHPRITEAALVAMPDERLGERSCAFVVGEGESPVSLAELREFLDSRGVAKYKWPERVIWLEEMPRASQVGKIDKKVLRTWAATLTPE